ncbi:MAG: hypothetical protein V7L09_08155 [Nostoc sp.]
MSVIYRRFGFDGQIRSLLGEEICSRSFAKSLRLSILTTTRPTSDACGGH